jgi:nickel/cobalt transporter (NicO) family protein
MFMALALLFPGALFLLQATSDLRSMLAIDTTDPTVVVAALGVAFFLGAAHALTPGHGKAIVAAYLVGSRGRIWDAVYLGGVVTATHTSSVFVLGLLTLYASQRFGAERIYPWLALTSGALVMGLGLWLLWRRWHGHDHGHSHSHTHGHDHSHGHHHSHSHSHAHSTAHAQAHSHSHAHAHAAVTHEHDHDHPHDHNHTDDHHHEHSHSRSHSHAHTSKGSLISLGISGGLVPCPEALGLLLIAISLNRLVFGLSILLAFSLGLAAVLIAIGMAMVMAAPLMKRFTGDGPFLRRLPVISAAVVAVLGLVIVAEAVRQFPAG